MSLSMLLCPHTRWKIFDSEQPKLPNSRISSTSKLRRGFEYVQLAESRYRHAADKLQKSENVIEKYKKKLEDSAGLRRELKSLEEENAALVNTNATLETELKKAGSAKALADSYRAQIETLEAKAAEQANQVCHSSEQGPSLIRRSLS